MAGAVDSAALATSSIWVPRRARLGTTRAHYGQVQSLPDLPTSVRLPDHARPQTGQATGKPAPPT